MTPRKTFAAGCLVGGVLSIALLFGGALGGMMIFRERIVKSMTTDLKAPPITTNQKADYSLKLTKLNGSAFDMAELKGKAVFLNFWSPNCSHCESELSAINTLYKQCYGFGVEFLCVALDSPAQIPPLVEKYQLDVPIVVLEGKRPAIYDSSSAPITFFLSPTGDIALCIRGAAKWDDISVAAILKLLSTVDKGSA